MATARGWLDSRLGDFGSVRSARGSTHGSARLTVAHVGRLTARLTARLDSRLGSARGSTHGSARLVARLTARHGRLTARLTAWLVDQAGVDQAEPRAEPLQKHGLKVEPNCWLESKLFSKAGHFHKAAINQSTHYLMGKSRSLA
ncbi:hypothetical protein BV898_12060 [Hypsibius exemplaris]|uniref:Uncharacterized protein n=1 Tax=Hypsibius exemplaris TaxID=2072580 RepID=A0A1W0WEW0_HYPEX|nr:hypothetical protein BV898_12060 [Hypsibius exemplaris]